MKFEKATIDEIDEILDIVNRVVDFMQNIVKINQWDSNYPNRERFLQDIEQEELYVLKDEKSIVGCICINYQIYAAYSQVHWEEHNNFKVLHRVFVDPLHHGHSYGKLLYKYAEEEVLKQNINYIRVDTFSLNTPMNCLIKAMGYTLNGTMHYKENMPLWNCYEKCIN